MIKPYYEEPNITIYCGDCLEVMKEIPDESIDLVLTDPPYNLSNKVLREFEVDRSKFRSKIMRRNKPLNFHFGEWDEREREDFLDFTEQWLKLLCKKLKEGGTIISFFNKEDISFLGWIAFNLGIRTRTIFTWCKTNPVPSFRKVNYLSSTEFIWMGSKGAWTTFNFGSQRDMKNYLITPNASSYGETEHTTEKPLSLITRFIKIHSKENDLILDSFLGSGTTLVACKELNRRGIGIEINPKYCDMAVRRLKNMTLNLL